MITIIMTIRSSVLQCHNEMADNNDCDDTISRWASLADRLNPKRAAFDAEFKAKWKQMTKAERQRLLTEDRESIQRLKQRGKIPLPFEADPDDHCETSPTAFHHVAPLLRLVGERLASKNQRSSPVAATISIYDPYYCAGGTASHLKALGFPEVYNQPEDFYQVIDEMRVPQHDILITNPPYSGDHFDRLLNFLQSQNENKPFLLLLPSHFAKRQAFHEFTRSCVYLTPPERYHYWTPEGRREDKTSSGKKRKKVHKNLHLGNRNSPFYSYWFVSLEPLVSKDELISLLSNGQLELVAGCKLHADPVEISGADQAFNTTSATSTDLLGGDATKRKRKKRQQANGQEKAGPSVTAGANDNPFLPPELQPRVD